MRERGAACKRSSSAGRSTSLRLGALAAAAPVGARPLSALDVLTLSCASAVAALLYLAVDLALANEPRLRALRGVA